MNMVPRIAIDARPLSQLQHGGFRAYVRSLIQGFIDLEVDGDPGVRLLLYLDRPLSTELQSWLPHCCETRVLDPDRFRSDLLLFGQHLRKDRPDLVHGTVNYLPFGLNAPATVTVHDAMGIKTYPWSTQVAQTMRQRLMNFYWKMMTRLSVKRAQRIITVSHGSAAELASFMGVSPERFAVVYNGITLPLPRFKGPRPDNVVLAIASPDLRKNLDVLYRALSQESGHFRHLPVLHVVCTNRGAASRAEEMLKVRNVTSYRLLHNLDDEALSDAYASATVFAWPSFMEGFGMPPLEAMRNGCPVVSSTAPVMPEILGEVPRYFDPERPEQLATELNALLTNRRECAERGELGRIHARRFTCQQMAQETLIVWKQVIDGKGNR